MQIQEMAFFDFDGTLSKGDSGWRFVLYCLGAPRFILCGVKAALKTLWGIVSRTSDKDWRSAIKENSITYAFKGRSTEWLAQKGAEFAYKELPKLRIETLHNVLKRHKEQNITCILVSASPETYLLPWAKAHGFSKVLATRLESDNGTVTGRLASANCKCQEKVDRIEAYLREENIDAKASFALSHAYGNSSGDYEMLRAVKNGWIIKNGVLERFS